jgi:acyl-coenzyme A synthetase/AMP-(fatty) acid ligase
MSTTVAHSIGADLPWIAYRPAAIDFGGPVDTPYECVPPAEAGIPAGLRAIRAAARRWPDKIAVSDGSVDLTYGQLIDRVNGLAQRVMEAVEPGGVVAAVANNGAAAVAILVAGFYSGRTLVPIDAGHPVERQTAIFAESGAQAVVVAKDVGFDRNLFDPELPVIEFDVLAATGAPEHQPDLTETSPCLVMFTSGSTGRPKGLAFSTSDASIRRFVDKFHVNSNDVFASLASMSQTGAADLIALATGASLCVVDIKRRGLTEAFKAFQEAGVTVLSFVPSVLRTLLALPGTEAVFAHLRVLDLHGERILASDIELFRSRLPAGCHISVSYGSTEAGGVFSWFVRDEEIRGPVVPIGYLAEDREVVMLSEAGAPCAAGEVGELLVRGSMALGSWRRGRVSTARFITDATDPTRKIYVTGDLVKMRPDGLFEIEGRRDRQVKIRGLWADLTEIEGALRAQDSVADAVVVVKSAQGAADSLVAFVTATDPQGQIDASALRRAVAVSVAEHMAPAQIRVLEAIPRLANYKPDLTRLDAMLAGQAAARAVSP